MFHGAKWSGDNSITMVLLLQDGWSPLMIASEKGHYEVVKTLIGAGAEVSQTNKVVVYHMA